MLVLFDIDGTLLHTLSAGIHAMRSALRDLHGIEADFGKVEIHGRLDTLIWRELGAVHGFPVDDDAHAVFKRTYSGHLERRFAAENTAKAFEGTHELVQAVRAMSGVTCGLLTGNYEPTGRLKVRCAGFDPDHFVVNAWGDDGPDRPSLVPVAMRRYREMHGRDVAPRDVLIIGDTPYDVHCAKAHGARVLAVATGHFDVDSLRAAGADRVERDLRGTPGLVEWIRGG